MKLQSIIFVQNSRILYFNFEHTTELWCLVRDPSNADGPGLDPRNWRPFCEKLRMMQECSIDSRSSSMYSGLQIAQREAGLVEFVCFLNGAHMSINLRSLDCLDAFKEAENLFS